MKIKNVLIGIVSLTLLMLSVTTSALPDTITCEFDGMVFVCSDNNAWGTIESAENYYNSLVPSYERVQPDYTFVTGGQTEGFTSIP